MISGIILPILTPIITFALLPADDFNDNGETFDGEFSDSPELTCKQSQRPSSWYADHHPMEKRPEFSSAGKCHTLLHCLCYTSCQEVVIGKLY